MDSHTDGLTGQPARPTVIHSTGIVQSAIAIYRELRQYRELLMELARRDIRVRYKQAFMGFGWAIFMPILVVLAGVIVRLAMTHMSGGELHREEVGSIAIKGIAWSFFVGTLTFATTSLTMNAGLVAKVYFPRAVLPLASLLAQMFDTTIGLSALLLLLIALGVGVSVQLAWVPLLIAALVAFTAALSLFMSCANVFFRDVKYIVQVLLTFGIFFTPVFFDAEMLGAKGALIVMVNPLSPILEGLRLSVISHHNLLDPLLVTTRNGGHVTAWSPWYLLYSAAWAGLGLFGSAALFHRAEAGFAENV